MKLTAIKTRKMLPPKDDLFGLLDESVSELEERSVVVITSKVVSIHEGRCVLRDGVDERGLIESEADMFLPDVSVRQRPMMMTIKNGTFIPKAGIDTSNANGYFILWPEDVQKTADEIRDYLINRFSLSEVGVLIIDSGLLPLRWGTVGVSIATSGFCPLIDYRKSEDVFGKKSMSIVTANVSDSLAAAANLLMGEGAEQTPIVVAHDLPFIKFGECDVDVPSLYADPKEDLFAPLISAVTWKKGEK